MKNRLSHPMRIFPVLLVIATAALTILPDVVAKSARGTLRAPRLQAKATIPTMSRNAGNRVILERADRLLKNEYDSFMTVVGNVEFSKGPMLMFCDSACYFPDDGSMNAYGNVRMRQGDTLFVYADEMTYSGVTEMAHLYGYEPQRPVKMINRDVKLETDVFVYDLLYDIGYYNTYGVLTDSHNRLTSTEGEYMPSTKDANFYDNVILTSLSKKNNDTLQIFTDTLFYNTSTHIAEFNSYTTIVNRDGTINTTEGQYNTLSGLAELFARSKVSMKRGTTLEGDTLTYDRNVGIGEAHGNMVLVDSIRQCTLTGNYGYYNEIADSAFVTGRAVAMEYSRGDTLFMHGRYITSVLKVDTMHVPVEKPMPVADNDTVSDDNAVANIPQASKDKTEQIYSDVDDGGTDSLPEENQAISNDVLIETNFSVVPDSTHVMKAWPRVRFYRSDLQGICDTMVFVQRDSVLHLRHHPVVWNGERQIFGNVIDVYMNDSTVNHAILPESAFTAELIEDVFYNQLSGKRMEAYFLDGALRRLELDGSVQAIYYPEEADSTINKMVYVESSFLSALFNAKDIERMKTWPETSGRFIPLYLAKKSDLFLPKFQWYEGLRPRSPEDILTIPAEMNELMGNEIDQPSDGVPDDDNAIDLDTVGVADDGNNRE